MKKIMFFIFGMILISASSYAADNYLFDAVSNTETAGSVFTVDVYARTGGGTDTGYNGTGIVTASHPTYGSVNVTPSSIDFVSGIINNVDFVVEVAGDIEFTVTDSVVPAITSWAGHAHINPKSMHHYLMLLHQSPDVMQIQLPGTSGDGYSPVLPTVTAGIPCAISIVAVDDLNNTIPMAITVTVNDWFSEPNWSETKSSSNGIAGYLWIPNPTGDGQYSFNTTLTPTFSLNGSGTVKIDIPDTFYMWVDVPTSIYAGVPFSMTLTASSSITAKEPSPGASGYYFRLDPLLPDNSAGHGTLTPTNMTIDSSGYKQSMFTYTTAEYFKFDPVRITPTDGKTIEIASSPLINVMAGAPTQISVEVSPVSIEAGHTATISVTVMDAYQNVVSGVPVQFTKTVGSDDAFVSPATDQTGVDGIARTTFTGGIINETAVVRCKVNAIEADVAIVVSVAPPSGDKMINYPNPLNPNQGKTSLNYFLNEESDVEIRVFDAFGRMVFSQDIKKGQGTGDFVGATIPGGANFNWDGRNGEGRMVANGIYLIKVKAKGNSGTQEFERRVGVLK
ncbi:T9SS type A sorting domain-containing protein [bacterium]|nr:T9SS type A sorting domain-containing protein [bacterium]